MIVKLLYNDEQMHCDFLEDTWISFYSDMFLYKWIRVNMGHKSYIT